MSAPLDLILNHNEHVSKEFTVSAGFLALLATSTVSRLGHLGWVTPSIAFFLMTMRDAGLRQKYVGNLFLVVGLYSLEKKHAVSSMPESSSFFYRCVASTGMRRLRWHIYCPAFVFPIGFMIVGSLAPPLF